MDRTRQPLLLLAAAIVAAALLMSPLRTAEAASEKMVITSCVDRRGFETVSGVVAVFSTSGTSTPGSATDGSVLPSIDAAFRACSADPRCIAFSNYGVTVRQGSKLMLWAGDTRACSYVRRTAFPAEPGFRLQAFSSLSPASAIFVRTGAAAQAACLSNPACTAWSTNGYYTTAGVPNVIGSSTNIATYLRQACPSKFGYTTHDNLALETVEGRAIIAAGRRPTAAEAEAFCKVNFQCSGFSSDGSYVIGGVGDYLPRRDLCSWVKHACAPMRGFTAYNDVAFANTDGQIGRPSTDCFDSVYSQCLANPACRAFNNMRYTYGANAPAVSPATTVDAPGMCLYVKIANGTLAA